MSEKKDNAGKEETAVVLPQSAIMIRITEGKNPRGIPTAKFIVSCNIYYNVSPYSTQDCDF